MKFTKRLTSTNGDLLSSEDATKYRSNFGGLQYLLLTRLDMSFSVNKFFQYLHAPLGSHWSTIKFILRYVHMTVSHGLHVCTESSSL
jgi:hypothetical protein